MSGHRIPFDLDKGAYELPDPGDGAEIAVAQWAHIAMTTGASGETNTLADPVKSGQRLALTLLVDGGGDRVITADSAINQTGNTIMTFGAAADSCILESFMVAASGTYKWRVVYNDGVALS